MYEISNQTNHSNYESLGLNWIVPIDGSAGLVCALKNIISILAYVQRNNCDIKQVNKIIANDIYPMLEGVKNEYDFILASIFMVIWSDQKDYLDEDKITTYARNVLGMFLEALEVLLKSESHGETFHENSESEEIDTSKLEVGLVVKNYKELCKLLRQEIKDGKSKKYQIENFKRYFDFEKSGQKFIITDIYEIPLPKEDKRKTGNNSIYVKYIELILLQYLSKQEGFTKTFTKRNWWELLGMVNRKYNKVSKKYLENIDYTITPFEINHFYQRCNKKLEQILFSALNNLKNRKLLIWDLQTVIVTMDEKHKEKYFLAGDEDKKKILQIERYILKNVMGFEKIIQVFCRFKQNEYYTLVNNKLFELYGWNYYFKQIKLIYTQKDVLDAIQQSEVDLQKALLNEKIIQTLNDNAKEKYRTDKQKLEQTRSNLVWGDYKYIAKSGVWNIPDTYLEAQRILTEELINIGHKDNKFLLEQFEDDNELNQLFTSFIY